MQPYLPQTVTIAYRAFQKHRTLHSLAHYTGMLSLQALARLALATGDPPLLAECRALLLPYVRGEQPVQGNFVTYECGGNASALLLWRGLLPEARAAVARCAEAQVRDAPRDPQGIFSMPNRSRPGMIWIDTAFAVTPFLLHAGMALEEDAYIEEGFRQIAMMYEIFRDPENGLLHQSRGFAAPGRLSEDHWSRGNGWALLALTELVRDLPPGDPRRPAAEGMFRDLVTACLGVQDENGLWHQELTHPLSYVETSGTGLILYAIGVGLAEGVLPPAARASFWAGLRGYRDYITPEGDVYHTCRGCLCPGEGRILDYEVRAPLLNDPHAFGPATLAFGQAYVLEMEAHGSS